jgi:pSer/pThr/pTyr-binding forkhead associated (FHA) protein
VTEHPLQEARIMQGNDSFRLVVRRGPQPNQAYDLNKDIVTLGRDITNDITINDPEVSRHHMRLTRGAGGYTIEDLGSTNGTFVNGQRLTGARPLRPGDMVGLGETVTLGYEMVSGAGAGMDMSPSPAQTAPVQRQPQPYAPPSPQQAPTAYTPTQPPPQQQQYGASYSPPPQPYGAPPPAAPPQAPPSTGYDYDPYEVREEEKSGAGRWILIGCVGITLFCCCGTLVGLVAVDQMCLWEKIPVLYDILQALGYSQVQC